MSTDDFIAKDISFAVCVESDIMNEALVLNVTQVLSMKVISKDL